MKLHHLLLLVGCFGLFSCSLFSKKNNEEKPLAKAYDSYLYPSNLEGVGKGLAEKDSIRSIETFIKNWVKREVILHEAKQDTLINPKVINEKLEKLRRDLFLYEYEKNLITHKQDTFVSEEEVNLFFEKNKENYLLKQSIFKGFFVQIDKNSKQIHTIRQLLHIADSSSLSKLEEIVSTEAEVYYTDANRWHNFDDISRNTPFENVGNQDRYLKNTQFDEKYANEFVYFLKIKEMKLASEIAPIEFHREMIKHTIIHKRRRNIIQKNEEELYDKAKEENAFEIYF